jgi:cysteine dioxygenase
MCTVRTRAAHYTSGINDWSCPDKRREHKVIDLKNRPDAARATVNNGGSLPKRILKLIKLIEEQPLIDNEFAVNAMIEADVQTGDILPWEDFGHPVSDSYGRKLVYNGGRWELMVMSWVPGDMSAIHDHGTAQWGAVKLFGPAENAVMAVSEGMLTTKARKIHSSGEVFSVAHDLIHSMGNVGLSPYITLHMYGCNEWKRGPVTENSRVWDLDEGKIQFTNGGMFFSLPDSAICEKTDALRSDFPTWIRHQTEMLKREMKKSGAFSKSCFQSRKEWRIASQLFSSGTWDRQRQELKLKTRNADRSSRLYEQILNYELKYVAGLQRQILARGLFRKPDAGELNKWNELLKMDITNLFRDKHMSLLQPHLFETAAQYKV